MRQEKTIELGSGRSLHAVQAGEGPDIVLLHGALATSHDWSSGPAFDDFVDAGFRVTAIDRPGHGRSLRRRFEGTPREQARQIRAGLTGLGVKRSVLVGHSFGGLVSLAYAELFGQEVARLVLVAPIAFPEPRLLEHSLLAPRAAPLFGPFFSRAAEATIDAPVLKLVQKLMFSPQPVPDWWTESFPYDAVLTPAAMVQEGEDTASILPFSPAGSINVAAISAPTSVIAGDADKIVQREGQGKLLARLMPNARYVEAEGVGHMIHHARPELLVEAVLDRAEA